MRLDHFSISVDDVEPMKEFFCEVIGLKVGDRPNFTFPGYWLYGSDGTAVVHLIQGQGNSKGAPGADTATTSSDTGAVDHLAFGDDDLPGLIERVEAGGWTYRQNALPNGSAKQVFIDGPEGVVIEVAFRA